jgi:hypothetical protein
VLLILAGKRGNKSYLKIYILSKQLPKNYGN